MIDNRGNRISRVKVIRRETGKINKRDSKMCNMRLRIIKRRDSKSKRYQAREKKSRYIIYNIYIYKEKFDRKREIILQKIEELIKKTERRMGKVGMFIRVKRSIYRNGNRMCKRTKLNSRGNMICKVRIIIRKQ